MYEPYEIKKATATRIDSDEEVTGYFIPTSDGDLIIQIDETKKVAVGYDVSRRRLRYL